MLNVFFVGFINIFLTSCWSKDAQTSAHLSTLIVYPLTKKVQFLSIETFPMLFSFYHRTLECCLSFTSHLTFNMLFHTYNGFRVSEPKNSWHCTWQNVFLFHGKDKCVCMPVGNYLCIWTHDTIISTLCCPCLGSNNVSTLVHSLSWLTLAFSTSWDPYRTRLATVPSWKWGRNMRLAWHLSS